MENPRRRRLKAWFKLVYGDDTPQARQAFLHDSGGIHEQPLTKGRLSQLFDDEQPFGEDAARKLAVRFGKDEDFFLYDRPEFGEIDDRATAKAEADILANLRDILRINPETHEVLVERIRAIAAGARAADEVIPKSKKGYVTPARAREKLGAPPPSLSDERAPSHDALLGGDSQVGGLDEVPAPTRRRGK